MSAPTETLIPVELHRGPFDGHRDHCEITPDWIDNRYLFERRAHGWIERIAYKPAYRTAKKGARWVLEFDCVISRQKLQGS